MLNGYVGDVFITTEAFSFILGTALNASSGSNASNISAAPFSIIGLFASPSLSSVDTTPPRWDIPCISLITTFTLLFIAASPITIDVLMIPCPPTPEI